MSPRPSSLSGSSRFGGTPMRKSAILRQNRIEQGFAKNSRSVQAATGGRCLTNLIRHPLLSINGSWPDRRGTEKFQRRRLGFGRRLWPVNKNVASTSAITSRFQLRIIALLKKILDSSDYWLRVRTSLANTSACAHRRSRCQWIVVHWRHPVQAGDLQVL